MQFSSPNDSLAEAYLPVVAVESMSAPDDPGFASGSGEGYLAKPHRQPRCRGGVLIWLIKFQSTPAQGRRTPARGNAGADGTWRGGDCARSAERRGMVRAARCVATCCDFEQGLGVVVRSGRYKAGAGNQGGDDSATLTIFGPAGENSGDNAGIFVGGAAGGRLCGRKISRVGVRGVFYRYVRERLRKANNCGEQEFKGVCHVGLLLQFPCGTQRRNLLKSRTTRILARDRARRKPVSTNSSPSCKFIKPSAAAGSSNSITASPFTI